MVRPNAGASVTPQPLPPITLANLSNGQSYTVAVIGEDATGLWQSESSPTVSRTWTIDTSSKRLVINEILAVNQSAFPHNGAFPGAVELYYDGPAAIDLSGMSISDDPLVPVQFVFPPGVTMHPGEYRILYAGSGSPEADLYLGFSFKPQGGAVYLFDKAGAVVDSVVFGQQLPDLSIGRVGPLGQWHLTVPTLGQANLAYPLGDLRTRQDQ